MSKGGKRKGSGRPEGTSRYGEKTKPIRIPLTLVPYIDILLNDYAEIGKIIIKTDYNLFY